MKKNTHLLILILLAAGRGLCVGADAAAAPTTQVGDYGHISALGIEGNLAFTKTQIVNALTFNIDYHLAAHPLAPLADYTAWLERKIMLGYRRAGFPSVTVKAAAETNMNRVVVRINEGPRYQCGDILLSGVKTMTNEVVRQKITDVLAGFETGSTGSPTNLDLTVWAKNNPAPLDEFFQQSLVQRVQEALSSLDYYQVKVSAGVVPDPVRRLADLKIEIIDEGIKGTIAEIEVSGLYTNTRAQLLDYLKLTPGIELHAKLLTTISNQLWNSARFFRQDMSLAQLPSPGQFKLTLDFDEVPDAPPLNVEFSEKEKAVLKSRDWMAAWEGRSEDFVFSLQFSNLVLIGQADFVVSPSGFAAAAYDSSSNLVYGAVFSQKLIGLYSAWRQSKFTVPRTKNRGYVLLKVRPESPKSYGQGDVKTIVNLNVANPQPFGLEMDLQPAVFLSAAHWMDSSLKDGVLTLSVTLDDYWKEARIDTATGRLLQAAEGPRESNDGLGRLRSEEGALARLYKEIAAATANHPNRYVTNHGFASLVSFFAADLMKASASEPFLDWLEENTPLGTGDKSADGRRQLKTTLALLREVLDQRSLEYLFAPLNRIFAGETSPDDDEHFVIPIEDLPPNLRGNYMATISSWVLLYSDNLLLVGSWPWILARESAFHLAGQGNYAQAELDRLLRSEDVGPVGCLVTACLLGRMDPKLARTFAERGLGRLSLKEFRRDYDQLLTTNYVVGELAANVLGLVGSVNEKRLAPLFATLHSDEAAFLLQIKRLLGNTNSERVGERIWPAFEQYWEKVPRRYLETALNHFLPQVQFLTNSQALYERGLELIAPNGAFQDFKEAAECFKKAADQGHGGAQLQLGLLCENGQGVPEDFAEAMRWYRMAATSEAPHANCRIAALYHNGKGVSQDLDEAARLYRIEAERDCALSQFYLAQILEAKKGIDDALPWYRRAAEGGATEAQAKLGDLLSDSISDKQDNVEAYKWLSLAADAGDKFSASRLNKLKSKLTYKQILEGNERAAAVAKRLQEKQRKQPGKR
jgi:TPR repeat protein